ncbi:MAG: serine/threonine-protein kinase [Myxococcota bacterium]
MDFEESEEANDRARSKAPSASRDESRGPAALRSSASELSDEGEVSLGRYRLFDEIGRGSMGSVHFARTRSLGYDRVFALKQVHPHLSGEEDFRFMFLDEIAIASRLSHPNVAGVVDFGEDDGALYFTMPYVLGETLRQIMELQESSAGNTDAIWSPLVARFISDACEGLHAAHELRDDAGNALCVVHRDVGLDNLMVGFDGYLRVIDFGIASAMDRLQRTTTGRFKGRFRYASPEQIECRGLDHRADVWALGVVLWELLAMTPLFPHRGLLEAVHRITKAPLPKLSSYVSVAPELEAIVECALQRQREYRFPTARDMGLALSSYLYSAGVAMGPADVSAWMVAHFPDQYRSKSRALARVRAASIPATIVSVSRSAGDANASSTVDAVLTESPGDTQPAKLGRSERNLNASPESVSLAWRTSVLGSFWIGLGMGTLTAVILWIYMRLHS